MTETLRNPFNAPVELDSSQYTTKLQCFPINNEHGGGWKAFFPSHVVDVIALVSGVRAALAGEETSRVLCRCERRNLGDEMRIY